MRDYRSWPSAQKIEKVCEGEGCNNVFLGHRRTLYCKECRYKISHKKKTGTQVIAREPKEPKEPKIYIAHCSCGRDHKIGEQEAKKYASVNGKIYKYCPKCEWKRGQYDLAEHSVIW